MKKLLILLSIIFLVQFQGVAQEAGAQSVYVELGGAGLAYSFNYDFRFDNNNINSWGMRIGAGGWARNDSWGSEGLLTMPFQLNKLFGSRKHFFELGGGATFVYYRDRYEDWTGESYENKNFNFILDTAEYQWMAVLPLRQI